MGKYIKFIQNNKLKISAATYNEEFELSEGSYTVSDIQDYFDYLKKTWRKDWQSFNKNICKENIWT